MGCRRLDPLCTACRGGAPPPTSRRATWRGRGAKPPCGGAGGKTSCDRRCPTPLWGSFKLPLPLRVHKTSQRVWAKPRPSLLGPLSPRSAPHSPAESDYGIPHYPQPLHEHLQGIHQHVSTSRAGQRLVLQVMAADAYRLHGKPFPSRADPPKCTASPSKS